MLLLSVSDFAVFFMDYQTSTVSELVVLFCELSREEYIDESSFPHKFQGDGCFQGKVSFSKLL